MGPIPEPCAYEYVYISGWTLQHGRRGPLGVGPLVSTKGDHKMEGLETLTSGAMTLLHVSGQGGDTDKF